jgi:hypothetical protein
VLCGAGVGVCVCVCVCVCVHVVAMLCCAFAHRSHTLLHPTFPLQSLRRQCTAAKYEVVTLTEQLRAHGVAPTVTSGVRANPCNSSQLRTCCDATRVQRPPSLPTFTHNQFQHPVPQSELCHTRLHPATTKGTHASRSPRRRRSIFSLSRIPEHHLLSTLT